MHISWRFRFSARQIDEELFDKPKRDNAEHSCDASLHDNFMQFHVIYAIRRRLYCVRYQMHQAIAGESAHSECGEELQHIKVEALLDDGNNEHAR